jgi:transcriptional regulator with XRE-family HTH domain
MFNEKTYRSVVEMVRDTAGDPALADGLERHLSERRLVKQLFALRCARGMSQKDIAEKMGCTQGRISKLEASRDEDLRFGDIRDYAKALGLSTILGLEGGPSAVVRVKYHHARIKKEVKTLAKLALKDEAIAEGVSRFFDEAALSFLTTLEEATKMLPPDVQPFGVSVEVVGPEDEAGSAEPDEPKVPAAAPRRRRSKKAVAG